MGLLFYIVIIIIVLISIKMLYTYIARKRYANITLQHTPATPKNTIIAFDLHDVLVRYDYSQIIKHFWYEKHKLKLFVAFLNPFLLYDTVKLFFKNAVAQQYIIGLAQKHPILKQYETLGIKIANSQKPVPQMIKLLKELKDSGYTLHMFSNIGSEIFKDLDKKLPHIFKDFKSFTLPSEQNGYIRKPSKSSFENYLSQNDIDGKQVIFIDDTIKNITNAYKYGIIGILYTCPCQLREQLKNLGILKNT